MYNKDKFTTVLEQSENKKVQERAKTAISLIERLDDKGIEDDKLGGMFVEWVNSLNKHIEGEKGSWSKAHKAYRSIVNYVEKQYKLQPKGNLQAIYFTIFLCFGIIFGSTTNMGIGIALGAGAGIAIGASVEKKAANEGRLY